MRAFFEMLDSGAYDRPVLAMLLVVFIASWAWDRVCRIRAKRAFYAAQQRAEEAFERLELGHPEVQRCIFKALGCWQTWQRRPVPLMPENRHATPVEWEAISLLQALPENRPSPYMM